MGSLVIVAMAGVLSPVFSVSPAAAQNYTLGIDVSHYQGTIDWNKVAESGHVFAFQKATEGATYTDPTYGRNRTGAGGASIPFGAYHFARPEGGSIETAQADAESEAQHFLDYAEPAPGDLLPVLDLEATGGLPSNRLIAWTQAWLDEVAEAIDAQPLVYSSPNFWQTNLADTTTFAEQGFPLWIAHYTSAPAPRTPASDWNGNGWAFWQWTNCASIPGIKGCVDEDRFSGSDLGRYTVPGAPEPEPTPDEGTPPNNDSPPEISGTTQVGEKLSASQGSWSGSAPISYAYSWRRCNQDGTNCTAVLNGTKPTYKLVPADYQHRMRVTVRGTNASGSQSADSEPSEVISDPTAPQAPRMLKPRKQYTLRSNLNVVWKGFEQDLRYDVRYLESDRDGRFGEHQALAESVTKTSASLRAVNGRAYCFSARAIDEADNASDWSQARCTSIPLDDRDLSASSGWKKGSGRAFYAGSFVATARKEATLWAARAAASDIYIVAQTCESCGRVAVLFNGSRVGTASLRSRRTRTRQLIHITSFGSIRRGQIKIQVISSGAPVKIDGLALGR